MVAGLITGARHAVNAEARQRVLAGEAFPTVKAWLVDALSRSYDLLERGLPGYCVRPPAGESSGPA